MKNFNLIKRLWTDSHEKQKTKKNQVGTKQGKKGTSLAEGSWVESRVTLEERRGNHAVITRKSPGNHPLLEGIWKYVAMIFAVLVMSVANIGMA